MSAWEDMLKRCDAFNKGLGLRREDFPPVVVDWHPAECSMLVSGEPITTEIDPVPDNAQGAKP